MKKRGLLIFVFGLLFTGLVACQEKTETTTTTTTKSTEVVINPEGLKASTGAPKEFKILCGPLNEYDPMLPDYTGDRVSEKQNLQRKIEQSYNVTIKYELYDDAAAWGPARIAEIKSQISAGTPLANAYLIDTSWLPQMTEVMAPVETYMAKRTDYVPSAISKQQASLNGHVYTMTSQNTFTTTGIFFNESAIKALQLENPADKFLAGNWTASDFKAWATTANNKVANSGGTVNAVFTGWAHYYLNGFIGSLGGATITPDNELGFDLPETRAAYELLQWMKPMYDAGAIADQGSEDWRAGKVLFCAADLWFLGNTSRFKGLNFDIGFVPFPVADGKDSRTDYRSATVSTGALAVGTGTTTYNGISEELAWNILFDIQNGLTPGRQTPLQSFLNNVSKYFDDEKYVEAYKLMQNGKGYYEKWESLGTPMWTNADPDGYYSFIYRAQELVGKVNEPGKTSPRTDISAIIASMKPRFQERLDVYLGKA